MMYMKGGIVTLIALAAVAGAAPGALASHRDDAEPVCTCSARLSYAKPDLQFTSDGLRFIPRVNIDIRLRGDQDGEHYTVGLRYEGATSYTSEDVAVPDGVNFRGEKTILSDVSCDSRWKWSGLELDRITLPGLTRTLIGEDQRLDGVAQMKTEVFGCELEEENRQFSWRMTEFGNLKVGSWRTVR